MMLRLLSKVILVLSFFIFVGCTNKKNIQINPNNTIKQNNINLIRFEKKLISMFNRIDVVRKKEILLSIDKKEKTKNTNIQKSQNKKINKDIIDISLENYMKEVADE